MEMTTESIARAETRSNGLTREHRLQIARRKRFAQIAEKVGSHVRAAMAQSVLETLIDELGGLEGGVWLSVLVQRSDLTRAEVLRGLDDLVAEELVAVIGLNDDVMIDEIFDAGLCRECFSEPAYAPHDCQPV